MNAGKAPRSQPGEVTLAEEIAALIARLPTGSLTLAELLDTMGEDGLLLLAILMTLVFLIPVSIPGVSTVFGLAILLIGISRLRRRPLWVPQRLARRALPADRLRPALQSGMKWVQRMEKIARPHRLRGLVDGRAMDVFNTLAFMLAALLLMAPFGFVPFSNTIPAVALLLYSIGFLQRDGGAVLLGHLANIGTMVYFGALIAGGGVAAQGLLQRITG